MAGLLEQQLLPASSANQQHAAPSRQTQEIAVWHQPLGSNKNHNLGCYCDAVRNMHGVVLFKFVIAMAGLLCFKHASMMQGL